MAKKKEKDLIRIDYEEEEMKIHLYGDILPTTVFQSVIELMKANRESESPRKIRFLVSSSMMLISVKYAIPSEFYESVELEDQSKKEVLKDAACL